MRFRSGLGIGVGPVLAVGLAAAGCGEVTAPSGDVSGLRASMALVDTVFVSSVVQSVGFYAIGSLLPAPSQGGPLMPDSLRGKTLTWSCASRQYAVSAEAGAPAAGVRFVLYQMAPGDTVACPATAIGNLDLLDVSAGGVSAVRAVAVGADGGVPVVDYTISHTDADSPGTARATGFMTGGQQRLAFSVSGEGLGQNRPVSTIRLDASAADLHVVSRDSAQMGVDTYSEGLDVIIRAGATTFELDGSTSWANLFRSWDERVSIDGVPFAKVSGNLNPNQSGGPTITSASGSPLTGEARAMVQAVLDLRGGIRMGLERVLGAGRRLVPLWF